MRFPFLFLTILLSAGFVRAQNADQPAPDNPTYQVTVTADRLEESVTDKTDSITIITRDEIEAHQWNYVIDALRATPGITILQSGSPGKVTSTFLRGASATQMLVLLDGVPVNNPYFGGIDLENLTTDNVERIEVLKGPQSPLYGSDSMAGVIQIFTRRGQGPMSLHTAFEGGSFQTYRESVGMLGAKDRLDYSLDYSRHDTNGQTDNDEFRQNVFTAQTGYRWTDNTRIKAVSRVYDSHTGIPVDAFFQPTPLQNQNSSLWLFSGGVEHHAGDFVNLNAVVSYNKRNYHIEDPQSVFVPLTESESGDTEFNLQNDFRIVGSTLSAGYEFEHQAIQGRDINGTFLDQTIQNHALFVQDKMEAGKLIVAAGVRWDRFNTFGNTVNPRISAAYKIAADSKLRASFGTAFRAPSAGDLYYPFYGNPDLKPEKSQSWEVGFDQYWRGAQFSASWFRNNYDDLITFDPLTFLAGNVAKAKTQGLELAGSYSVEAWKFSADYTYLDAKDEIADRRLYRRPKHTANLTAEYRASRWGAAVSLLAMGNRLETDYRPFPSVDVLNPGFATLSLAAQYQLTEALQLKGRLENLTDKQYEQILGYPSPGIGFYGGIAAAF